MIQEETVIRYREAKLIQAIHNSNIPCKEIFTLEEEAEFGWNFSSGSITSSLRIKPYTTWINFQKIEIINRNSMRIYYGPNGDHPKPINLINE